MTCPQCGKTDCADSPCARCGHYLQFAPTPGSVADREASLAAIHYHAARPAADKIGLLAQLASIVDECERNLPELKALRPQNGKDKP